MFIPRTAKESDKLVLLLQFVPLIVTHLGYLLILLHIMLSVHNSTIKIKRKYNHSMGSSTGSLVSVLDKQGRHP